MDASTSLSIVVFLAVLPLLWWFQRRSLHPMSDRRRRALLILRGLLVGLLAAAVAHPTWRRTTHEEAVIFIVDHSQSSGEEGWREGLRRVGELTAELPSSTQVGVISAGSTSRVIRTPTTSREPPAADPDLPKSDGEQTDLESAVLLARGLFPPNAACRIVLVSDGFETRGDLEGAARDSAAARVTIDALPTAGRARPDVRVVRLRAGRSQLDEGAAVDLTADVESSLAGPGRIRLFENGIEVEARPIDVEVGRRQTVVFSRTPPAKGMYAYRVQVEGFADDELTGNDEGRTLVDVHGRPSLLYVEGEPSESHYLVEAMDREGLRLEVRPPSGIPSSLEGLAGFDGVIVSDVPARELTEAQMTALRDYVERLGGGFVMVGGSRSFGVGGYYRTPIEEILPVKIKAPDTQVRHATALALVVDRSGSMQGQKLELCKAACAATVELLNRKDFLAVVAFDDQAHWVVPLEQVSAPQAAISRIAGLTSGGGTNLQPAMTQAYEALKQVSAKIKHMIVLTDGQTSGGGYEALAAQMKTEMMTVSTVAIGSGAHTDLLQKIAAAGGGQAYVTSDPTNIPQIFTQDAMVHIGKLIHEDSFSPKQVERHPMLAGWDSSQTPPLLGYVKTNRKAAAQAPLVTDLGDPLLAQWRYGLGKVTAFTSDCKSRWAVSWISGWPGYSRFWAQVLRETARSAQGRGLELNVAETRSRWASVRVDLSDASGDFKNDADVAVDVYRLGVGSAQSGAKLIRTMSLAQSAPGRYEREFPAEEAGVYLVRARAAGETASAGFVSKSTGEAATGRVDNGLLERVCRTTGGRVLEPNALKLTSSDVAHVEHVDLTPLLIRLVLLVFLADIAIRRWENVQGIWELIPKFRARVRK
jgi:Ca-activated chloride channel homolog